MMELGRMVKRLRNKVTPEQTAVPESFAAFSDALDGLHDLVQRTVTLGGVWEKGELLDAQSALADTEAAIRASSEPSTLAHLGVLIGRVSGIRKTIEANLEAFEPDPDERAESEPSRGFDEGLREAA